MNTVPDPTDQSALLLWIILSLVGVIATLAAAVRYLFNQMLEQQKKTEGLLGETRAVMGSVSELIRSNNSILVETKDAVNKCRRDENHDRT